MNYNDIEELLFDRKEFKSGKTMSARYARNELGELCYCVYSYATLIATYNAETRDWWLNEEKYSKTTSRQQNIVRRVAGLIREGV